MVEIMVGTGPLTRAEVVAVARHRVPVRLSSEAQTAVADSRARIDVLAAAGDGIYGVSTGFGALAARSIPAADRARLQRSLIRSHAAGNGPLVEDEVVRALMLLRISTLAKGYSGVRPATVAAYVDLLNSPLVPAVHEYGSLGCSGDLSPLAHCALVLSGEGEVLDAGVRRPAAEALAEHGLVPVELAEKEGLALINGTDGMLGMLVLALADLEVLVDTADLAAALSVEGQLATDQVFAPELMALRPQVGQGTSASHLRAFLAGSPLMASHRDGDGIVQDAYSLRCSPQVHGALRDAVGYATTIAERELCAAIDNPSVLTDGRVASHGNFHGAPLAHVLDFLAIGIADVAAISGSRTDRFLDVARNRGLPAFLADDPGIDSGLMIAQYTQAGICSSLKQLATPASVDSISSSAGQEDHVSMGWNAARKLRRAIDGLGRVLAIEILTAARGIDLRMPLRPGPATGAAISVLRETVPGPGPDRFLAPEIEATHQLVIGGELIAAALGQWPAVPTPKEI
jgi:histidine ammonia-lyase